MASPARQRSSEALSEALYESIFENMLDGLAYCEMVFDKNGQPIDFIYRRVNKNFEKLTGLKNAEGKRVTELIPGIKSTNPELLEIYGRVSTTGKPENFESHVEPLHRWFLVSAYRPTKGFFVAIFQNITEPKRIEQELENAKIAAVNVLDDLQSEKGALARAKAKDEALLASMGDGLITTDVDGKIVLVNPSFEHITGWRLSEVRGKQLTDILPLTDSTEKTVPQTEHLIQKFIARQITKTTTIAAYFKKKNESLLPVSITISPMYLGRQFLGLVEVFRDISAETIIDRAKSEFVSLASHQLKTPLTTIGWYTEILMDYEKERLSKKGKECLKKIFRNNNRMVALIDALLNVSRIDLGTLAVVPVPIRLETVADSVIEDFGPQMKKKRLQVIKQIPKNLPTINADPQLMRTILQNLLSNAVKYSFDNGKISLTIEHHGTKMLLTVSDHGCGIPTAQQAQIFTKLFRADNAREMDSDGTGLGLYIAKAAVEQSGGAIRFESIENKGTTFYVSLPLKGVRKKEGTKGLI